MDSLKNGFIEKTGPQGLKMLSFVPCHMKDNFEVINFHIKGRGVQGLVFVQITFEKCTTSTYIEIGEVVLKTKNADL